MRKILMSMVMISSVLLSGLTAESAATAESVVTAESAATADRNPVIFVHGLFGRVTNWVKMINDFKAAGWPEDQLFTFGYDFTQSNRVTAAKLADEVTRVRRLTGAEKVDLVSHSMGGLSSRWYLKFLGGTADVDAWVSIGGPNHGTDLAGLCSLLWASCREMRPGSSMLTSLNASQPAGPTRYATLWSRCDEIINPDSSALVEGAVNISAGCVEHALLLTDDGVSRRVRDFVR